MKIINFVLISVLIILLFGGIVSAQSELQGEQSATLLNHIAINVVDLEKSTNFYKDVLQLTMMQEPFHDGIHTWFNIGGNSQLHLIQRASAATEHDKNTHLCFSVKSVDEFVRNLDAHNIDRINWVGDSREPTVRVDGVKQIYFQDPDGYWIEINDDFPGKK